MELGIAKLMDNGSETSLISQIGNINYGLLISPQGEGFIGQKNFMIFSQSLSKDFITYTFMVSCEQSPKDPLAPTDPNAVITREFWGTNDRIDISNAAHLGGMMNSRGVDLLKFDENRKFEQERDDNEYKRFLFTKEDSLPIQLKSRWKSAFVPEIVDGKYDKITGPYGY
ncbi:MAG: hypothetical protein HQM08_25470 [Candidatus Riflebacteria bacterium]|nr:hypothetical protein [Candidatus Riflebacteria bacterium]